MMKRLRGRNLAHPGCLIGVTVGLSLGIILAGLLASVFLVPYNIVLWVWLGATIGLGAIGWIVGAILTPRFPVLPEEEAEQQSEQTEDETAPVTTEATPATGEMPAHE